MKFCRSIHWAMSFLGTFLILGSAQGDEGQGRPLNVSCEVFQDLSQSDVSNVTQFDLKKLETQVGSIIRRASDSAPELIQQPAVSCSAKFAPRPFIGLPVGNGNVGLSEPGTCASGTALTKVEGRISCSVLQPEDLAYLEEIDVPYCKIERKKGIVEYIAIGGNLTQEMCDVYSKEQQKLN